MTPGRLTVLMAPNGRSLIATGGFASDRICDPRGIAVTVREAGARAFAALGVQLADSRGACDYGAAMDDAGRATVAWANADRAVAALSGATGTLAAAAPIDAAQCTAEPASGTCRQSTPLVSAAGTRTTATWLDGKSIRVALRVAP